MIDMFGFLAAPLAIIMRFIYDFIQNYGWTIIIFTFLVRIIMIPLSLMQQKSTARMSAYQPFIQEIQKKWANDKNRQSQELQKFYTENKIKMTGGCLPMLINMLVLFGIIGVIQAPLQYMVGMPKDQIQNAIVIMAEHRDDIKVEGGNNYTIQSVLIGEMKQNPEWFTEGANNAEGQLVKVDQQWVQKVDQFNFQFLGLNLAERPTMDFNVYLILPILSILTMFASQIIMMRTSGTMPGQSKNTMMVMTVAMGLMFGFFAFTVPVGFSLYYTVSNVALTVQQLFMKKIYDPEKLKAQILQELEEKKQAKKAKKVVTVKDNSGQVIQKEMSDAEIARLRLERARQLDAERYSEEHAKPATADEPEEETSGDEKPEENPEENTNKTETDKKPEEKSVAAKEEYKPGRRLRSKLKKEDGDEGKSFVDEMMEEEKRQESEEET